MLPFSLGGQRGKKVLRLFLIFLGVFLVCLVLFISFLSFFCRGRILPGVVLAGQKVGGVSYARAQELLGGLASDYNNSPYELAAGDTSWVVFPQELGIKVEPSKQAAYAYNLGREKNFLRRGVSCLRSLLFGVSLNAWYELDEGKFYHYLESYLLPVLETSGLEAEVMVEGNSITYLESREEKRVVKETLLSELERLAGRLAKEKFLEVPLKTTPPHYNTGEAKALAEEIEGLLAKPIKLKLLGREYNLEQEPWRWIKVVKEGGEFRATFDETLILGWLKDLAGRVDRETVDAELVIKGTKVVSFRPDEKGYKLDLGENLRLILETLNRAENREAGLKGEEIAPRVRLENVATLGIKELVARGVSNFTGSPPNRISNIKTGAARFNNVLVEPGGVFSFNRHLGVVDSSTGYLPELVIKGDETTPEYGGGLCQISTTFFRAVLNGGYPVVERKNHSYRVIYYEPAGTDATVYPPYPDFKFINDGPNYLLIKTYVKGEEVYFDFYGTKPPYRVELDGPYIYNVTSYPEPVYLETSTLPPGARKKIDTAHRGADAVLYRYLYDEVGNLVRKDIFRSHYVPWPAKYLLGAEEAPEIETREENIAPPPSEKEIPQPSF